MTGTFYQDFTRIDLLNLIFSGVPVGAYFELTYILPPELAEIGPSPITESYQLGGKMPDWDRVDEMNARGYGVYYALTPKRQPVQRGHRSREANAAWCTVLWTDVDIKDGHYTDKDAAHDALAYMRPVPTALVDSGGGIHALWRIQPVQVTKTTLPRLKQTLRGLAISARGDTSVAELARVFRLPDTINTKPERKGARCEVLDIQPIPPYSLAQFGDYHNLAQPQTHDLRREFKAHKPEGTPAYITWYLDTAHPEGERNNRLNWTAHKMHSDGFTQREAEVLLIHRALADGLSEKEAARTIQSAFNATRGVPSYVSKAVQLRMKAGGVIRRVMDGGK